MPGPGRKEIITRETLDRVLDWFAATDIPTLDLTGGAPEMIPDFREAISRPRAMTPRRRIIDRCNLTILLDPAQDGLAEFLAENEVEIEKMPFRPPQTDQAVASVASQDQHRRAPQPPGIEIRTVLTENDQRLRARLKMCSVACASRSPKSPPACAEYVCVSPYHFRIAASTFAGE